jgi:hypothetical protein
MYTITHYPALKYKSSLIIKIKRVVQACRLNISRSLGQGPACSGLWLRQAEVLERLFLLLV